MTVPGAVETQHSLDHIRNDPIRLPRARIISRLALSKHLQRRVPLDTIRPTQLLLLGTVHLGELDALFGFELGRGFFVVRGEATGVSVTFKRRDDSIVLTVV